MKDLKSILDNALKEITHFEDTLGRKFVALPKKEYDQLVEKKRKLTKSVKILMEDLANPSKKESDPDFNEQVSWAKEVSEQFIKD